jgi:hypothetical protein
MKPIKIAGHGLIDMPSRPLPPAVLVPYAHPLYDTEDLPGKNPDGNHQVINSIEFFTRVLSNAMAYGNVIKRESETNMVACGSLPNPNHFGLLGFSVRIGEASKDDLHRILEGTFEFTAFGTRILYQVPIHIMAVERSSRAYWEALAEKNAEVMNSKREPAKNAGLLSAFAKSILARKENPTPFIKGDTIFMILPGESFGVRLSWPRGLALEKAVRVTVLMEGFYYISL